MTQKIELTPEEYAVFKEWNRRNDFYITFYESEGPRARTLNNMEWPQHKDNFRRMRRLPCGKVIDVTDEE